MSWSWCHCNSLTALCQFGAELHHVATGLHHEQWYWVAEDLSLIDQKWLLTNIINSMVSSLTYIWFQSFIYLVYFFVLLIWCITIIAACPQKKNKNHFWISSVLHLLPVRHMWIHLRIAVTFNNCSNVVLVENQITYHVSSTYSKLELNKFSAKILMKAFQCWNFGRTTKNLQQQQQKADVMHKNLPRTEYHLSDSGVP